MVHELSKKFEWNFYSHRITKQTRAILVVESCGGVLIELVILCECGRDDVDVFEDVAFVLSRLASVSDLIFCFIASVGSTYHLK